MASLVLPKFVEDEQLEDDEVFVRPNRKRKIYSKTQKTVSHGGLLDNNQSIMSENKSLGLESEMKCHQRFPTNLPQRDPRTGYPSQLVSSGMQCTSRVLKSSTKVSQTLPDSTHHSDQLNSSGNLSQLVPPSAAERLRGNTALNNTTCSDDELCSKQMKHDEENYSYNLFDPSLSGSTNFGSQQLHVLQGDDHKKRKNREAAARCRSRKHDRIRKLEEKSRELLEENDQLERAVWALKRERDGIREAFMYHLTNDCHGDYHGNF